MTEEQRFLGLFQPNVGHTHAHPTCSCGGHSMGAHSMGREHFANVARAQKFEEELRTLIREELRNGKEGK